MADWLLKYETLLPNITTKYPEENFISLKSAHGHPLATYRFHHPNPKALVICLHSFHAFSNTMSHIAKAFNDVQCAVAALDQEGHGKSGGERGTVTNLESLVEDTISFIEKTKEIYSKIPVFLVGFSIGGALSILACMKKPELVRGIVLLAPAVGIDPNFMWIFQKIASFLNNCCCRRLRLQGLDIKLATRNPYFIEYYKECPEFYKEKINIQTIDAITRTFRKLQQQIPEFTNSVLLVQGEQDKITSVQLAKGFIRDCKSQDKEILIYPEMYHGVPFEPEFDEILPKCIDWVMARI